MHTCPNCGYCEHCKRANPAPIYPAPYIPPPVYPQPVWRWIPPNPQPWTYITTTGTTSASITC